jgi:hypothetical protein
MSGQGDTAVVSAAYQEPAPETSSDEIGVPAVQMQLDESWSEDLQCLTSAHFAIQSIVKACLLQALLASENLSVA